MNKLVKIAEIDCGCAKNCGGRMSLLWDGQHLVATTPHGVEYPESGRVTTEQAARDAVYSMYSSGWNLQWVEEVDK